ncbi:DUF3617 domain-containing protein [Sphingomonas sp. HITSZ_GF]|uniref:DUF3617 domain-containing protein n=1 Tax=Sphingomonas sp. HITSZ_GF TaxID=3037247 RepID=UPI00240D0782|nr:DUF3617 domain-containing protein [Sphingomonas sp. HITSZ_GF]MDG2534698.1 DUF3617 domain-containing protein [Sphingomonas sp. HITSZ_GF]
MRLTILAAGALLPLAACNQGPSTEQSARQTGEIRLENASMEEVAKQSAAADAKTAAQPGQWENSFQLVALETGGVPEPIASQMKAELGKPPKTETSCRKAEDVKPIDVSKLSPMQRGCTFPKYKVVGGKIDAVMECDTPMGKSHMTITGSQTKTSYDLTMSQSQTVPGQTKQTSMTVRITGKRLGECKA